LGLRLRGFGIIKIIAVNGNRLAENGSGGKIQAIKTERCGRGETGLVLKKTDSFCYLIVTATLLPIYFFAFCYFNAKPAKQINNQWCNANSGFYANGCAVC